MQHHEPECHAEILISCLQCQGHKVVLHDKSYDYFLLYLLNCWSVCNQTWLLVQHHKPECPLQDLDYCVHGQGHSKGSKWRWMFVRMMIVFWIAEWLVTNLGMVKQCVMWEKNCLQSSRSKSQQGLSWSNYDYFNCIIWTVDSLATKHGLMIHHHKPECLVKNWIPAVMVKVTVKGQHVSVCPDDICSKPPNILLPNLVLWCFTVTWSACKKIGVLFSRSRS